MSYEPTLWVDGENKYHIKDQAGNIIHSNIKLEYAGTEATPVNAGNMNKIEAMLASLLSDETAELFMLSGTGATVNNALLSMLKMHPSIYIGDLLNNTYVETKTCTNGEVLPALLMCKNFIVPAGATVTTQQKKLTLVVADTVQIDGIISADGKGGAGGIKGSGSNAGNGGAGGGNLFIIANSISGSGKISANGVNGTNAGTYASNVNLGTRGEHGYLPDKSIAYGGWCGTASGDGNSTGAASISDIIWQNLNLLGIFFLLHSRITGGGGGGGGQGHTSTSTQARSATGGAGAGGNSGASPVSATGAGLGGGGGGGGGLIVLLSRAQIPATLTIEAKGGNGGTGSGTNALTGGGGGGGAIICFSPALLASTSVTGGLTGTGAASGVAGLVVNTVI